MFSIIKRNPLAASLAVLLHVAIALFLIFGMEWELFPQKARPKVNVVQAHTVDEEQLRDKEAEEKARQRERQQAAQKRKEEQARKRKLAEEKKRKAELAAKQKAEAKRQAELKRKAEAKRQAEVKRKADAEAKRQAEAKRKAEAKRQAELAAKRKAEEAARREAAARAEREQALQEQLAAEQNAREIDRYVAVITQHIERNWWKPDQLKEQLSCVVRVRLIPGGDVLPGGVSITKSSGNDTFDRTVVDAVYRAAPLPVPSGPLFDSFRSFSLRFKPEM